MLTVKDFVKTTIEQIAEAVNEVTEGDSPVTLNPLFTHPDGGMAQFGITRISVASFDGPQAQNVSKHASIMEFDIAVTASDETGSQAEGQLKVVGLSIGGGAEDKTQQQNVSRVKFSLPVEFEYGSDSST